jgi:hypothetical protein
LKFAKKDRQSLILFCINGGENRIADQVRNDDALCASAAFGGVDSATSPAVAGFAQNDDVSDP